jgi:hypothetical protein
MSCNPQEAQMEDPSGVIPETEQGPTTTTATTTRQQVPFRRPMSKRQQAKALAKAKYIEKKQRERNVSLETKDIQCASLLTSISALQWQKEHGVSAGRASFFRHYIILEIVIKNRMKWHANNRERKGWIRERRNLELVREKCWRIFQANPRWHGKVYREVINAALAEAGMLYKLHMRFSIPFHEEL